MSSPTSAGFDPLAVPLQGIHLIEASAGTGKTWAIVSLLLRAIAIDGLLIDQAVLVTFTEAATRELRQRVRLRLESAQRAIDAPGDELAAQDQFVEQLLLEADRQGLQRAQVRQRIRDALVRCDDAWVSTIHALCGRWLSESAFDQGHSLQSWPLDHSDELRREAVTDVWRRFVVLADAEQAEKILRIEGSRDKMFKRLRQLLSAGAEQVDGADSEERLSCVEATQAELLIEARELADAGEFSRLIEHLGETGRYNRNRLSAKHLDVATRWIDAALQGAPPEEVESIDRILPVKLAAALNKDFRGEGVPGMAALDWLENWQALAVGKPALEAMFWLHRVLQAAREREAELQQRHRQLSFDALILQISDAVQGPTGPQVARQLAERFPLLIVDEFQDTDADQYAIFRAIAKSGADRIGLFLVGDPKQAIYRFRGGDIFAYRRAMQDADCHHGLQHNYRSQRRLVTAVNALFDGAGKPFAFDFIEFTPALLPADRDVDDPSAGLVVWQLPAESGPMGKGDAERRVFDAVAAEVTSLIEAGPDEGTGSDASIAVLVASNAQARELREMLESLGVACAYAGDQSVWAAPAARALMTVVDALASPRDSGKQRRVMAGEFFELDADALQVDETVAAFAEREAAAQALVEARARLLRRGPAAALLPLTAAAAARRLRSIGGRRWVADALHLLDLLDELWSDAQDAQSLLQAIQSRISAADETGHAPTDGERLRAETDHADVVLMTVHGSKGLQFDTVIAPFLWQAAGAARPGRDPQKLPPTVSYHELEGGDSDGELRFDPGTEVWPLHSLLDTQERFAESLRLTYVALTRAKRRAYVVCGAVEHRTDASRSSSNSAVDYLLRGGAGASDSDGAADLVALNAWRDRADGAVEIRALPESRSTPIARSKTDRTVPPPRTFRGSLSSRRRIVSYSGLFGGHQDAVRPDRDVLPLLAEDVLLDAPANVGGTRFGECAHAALERIDFGRWPSEEDSAQIESACRRYGFGPDAERYLIERIDVLTRTPLIDGLQLGQTLAADRQVELEFFFPLDRATLSGFFAALEATPDYAREGPWPAEELSGFMRGFVDLIVRRDDRYYVIDYKTNHLGATRSSYAPSELARSVRQSNYDLQYLVYCLALHRHLAHRLGADYRPEHHLGGVCYIYLRGLDEQGEHGVFVDRPSPTLIATLDSWAAGAAS